ncbi:unnamed protein product [Caretta caretta]
MSVLYLCGSLPDATSEFFPKFSCSCWKFSSKNASLIRFADPGLVDTGADVTVIRDLEWPDRCGFRPGVCDRH